jgi:hypothetical protein
VENVAFQNSGVLTKLRLVYSGYIDATQTNDFCSNLDRMMYNTNSAWVNARNLRNLYKADLMHMIIDNSNSCGCAYIDGWVSVSHRGCTTGYFSFGHEVGHNFVSVSFILRRSYHEFSTFVLLIEMLLFVF